VRDVEAIKATGRRHVAFVDDSLAADHGYLKDLCRALEPLRIRWMVQCTLSIARRPDVVELMARSGCCVIGVGIEGLTRRALDSVSKRINSPETYSSDIRMMRSHGIDVSTEMMVALDGDTEDVFEHTRRFIAENHIAVPRFHIVTPIPGTPLYDQWAREGRITDHDLAHYTGARLVFRPLGMPAEAVEPNYWRMYERLFTLRSILRRFLGSRPTRGALVNIFTLGANFHYASHIRRRIPPGIV
jgi:radical SAM superfamily enzyme YgiQ (UPF0313 family)